MATTFKVGDKVYFGRPEGEQTLGEVVKVNQASVKIRQLEVRGVQRVRQAGALWKVHPSFVRHADPSKVPAPAPKRPEDAIMKEVAGCYCRLSPENLSGDGEYPASYVRKRRAQLVRMLADLFAELGRRVSEEEAYAWESAQTDRATA